MITIQYWDPREKVYLSRNTYVTFAFSKTGYSEPAWGTPFVFREPTAGSMVRFSTRKTPTGQANPTTKVINSKYSDVSMWATRDLARDCDR